MLIPNDCIPAKNNPTSIRLKKGKAININKLNIDQRKLF